MKDEILSRALRIDDSRCAAALSNPLRRRIVLSLVGRSQSLTELSQTVDVELKRLHYHVTALVDIGLLQIQGVVRRAGRPIKRYVAVAHAFYVPDGLAVSTPGEALALELRKSLTERRRISGVGTVYDVDAEGNHRMRPRRSPRPREVAWIERWQVLQLSAVGVRGLADELSACIARAAATRDEHGLRTYLVHVAVAPRPGSGRGRRTGGPASD